MSEFFSFMPTSQEKLNAFLEVRGIDSVPFEEFVKGINEPETAEEQAYIDSLDLEGVLMSDEELDDVVAGIAAETVALGAIADAMRDLDLPRTTPKTPDDGQNDTLDLR